LILQDYTASKIILWLINHMEIPLTNLIGHGDVCVYSLSQIQEFCANAGFYIEKLEAAKKFRLHLVAKNNYLERYVVYYRVRLISSQHGTVSARSDYALRPLKCLDDLPLERVKERCRKSLHKSKKIRRAVDKSTR